MTRFVEITYTVEDRRTGLVWTKSASIADYPMTWQEALEFVGEMNSSRMFGHDDWRLPNRKELFSLIRHHHINPCLASGHPFENVFHGYYWTSTTCARLPAQAWTVHLGGARMVTGMKHRSFMVWPVRDGNGPKRLFRTGQQSCYDEQGKILDCMHTGQDAAVRSGIEWPVPRLTQTGDVVVDRQTGLSWTQNANIGIDAVSWDEAFAVVEKLNRINAYGFSDWRLPSIIELESLADMGKHSPALPDPTIFTDIRDFYWSSTTSRFQERYAWALYLQDGAVGVGFKPLKEFFVWAVRGGLL